MNRRAASVTFILVTGIIAYLGVWFYTGSALFWQVPFFIFLCLLALSLVWGAIEGLYKSLCKVL